MTEGEPSLNGSALKELHPAQRELVLQLLKPSVMRLLEDNPDEQVEIRLYVSRGKVRRKPTIVLNGGPNQEYSKP